MRFLLVLIFSIISIFSAQAQEVSSTEFPLKTQMDPSLKNMIDIISTALLQKVPGVAKDSKIEMSAASSLGEGRAQGLWSVSVTKTAESAPLFSMNGTVELSFLAKDNVSTGKQGVYLQMTTTAQISKDDLYKMISLSYQKMGGDLQLFQDPAVSPAVAMQKYKEQAITYVQSLASAEPIKKKQTFGARQASQAADSNSLDAETVAQLAALIEQSLIVSETNGETTVHMDLSASREAVKKVAQQNAMLNLLTTLGSMDLKIANSSAQWVVRSEFEVSKKVIETYDAYLSSQQGQELGLTELSELITKLGAWAVGRCSTEAYQTMCVDNLINVCTKNIDRVQKCVDDAKIIQSSRESNTSGDTFSTIANGVSLLSSRTGTTIEDWFSSDDEEPVEPEGH